MNTPKTTALSVFTTLVLLNCAAQAQMLTQAATAPTGSIISQPDFSGGSHGNPDYSNQPTPGQTFTPTQSFTMTSFTIKGSGSNNSDNGTDGNFHFQIGSVSGTTITPLDTEAVAIPNITSNTTNYLTFTLGTAVPLTAGTTYAFSLYTSANNFYFGYASGPAGTDSYSGGTAFDNANTGSFSNTIATTLNYDRTFFIGGTGAVPEPSTVTLGVIAAGGLFVQLRRRGFLKN